MISEKSLGDASASLRANGADEADVDELFVKEFCLVPLGRSESKSDATSSKSSIVALDDDGGVGASDVRWSTSLWYEPTNGRYYALGEWTWLNHDYAADAWRGCINRSLGGPDAIGMALSGGEYEVYSDSSQLWFWGDPGLNDMRDNYGIGSITSPSGTTDANQYGIAYQRQDHTRALSASCDNDVDFDMYGGQIMMSFTRLADSCSRTQVFVKNGHSWGSTAINGVSVGPFSVGISWTSSDSRHEWQHGGVSANVCGSGSSGGGGGDGETGGGDSGGGGGTLPPVRGDFDGDRKADIIARHAQTKDLRLYAGNGSGSFVSGTGGTIGNNWGNFDIVFSPGDFSGDGKPDILARHATTKDLHLYAGDGSGGFRSATGGMISNNWGNFDIIFSPGDFSGDGKPDILARHATTKDLHLYAGDGNRGFKSGTGGTVSNNWGNFNVVFSPGDFDGDGKADIIARHAGTADLHLYAGNGAGGFKSGTGGAFSNDWRNFDMIFSPGDFTGDGKADVVARQATTRNLHLYAGNGAGGFNSGTGGAFSNDWSNFDIIAGSADPSRGAVSVYGVLSDGRLTYSKIESGTGDRFGSVISTAKLGFTPKAMATLNFNTLLITSTGSQLYRVDIITNNSSLTFNTPVLVGASGWTHDRLAYDGNGSLFGVASGTLLRYTITAVKPTAGNIINGTTIGGGFTLLTLATTGPGWILGTNSEGKLLSYKIHGAGSWTPYTLRTGWGAFVQLTSPGGGFYYGRNSSGGLYRYLDANPFDGNGTDIRYYGDDPVDTGGWTQILLSAQPFGT
ncbi:FG-GAP repeat domain-containing protein [Micromonospora citrea]|uniref:FG-GAP repeat domain-containing protein n=1 Tax=Micromonospora citrea TaxID=47855 RepID=UPI003C50B763